MTGTTKDHFPRTGYLEQFSVLFPITIWIISTSLNSLLDCLFFRFYCCLCKALYHRPTLILNLIVSQVYKHANHDNHKINIRKDQGTIKHSTQVLSETFSRE